MRVFAYKFSINSQTHAFTTDIIDNLGIDILPYIVLLIVPVLGQMSDHSEDIRLLATNCFATLVQLMPLEVKKNFELIYILNDTILWTTLYFEHLFISQTFLA